MMTGKVTFNRKAIIELKIIGSNREQETVEAIIDTGFNGDLTLSSDLIYRLKFQPVGNRHVTLGDGSMVILDVYLGKVLWHGQEREVLVLQSEGGSLVGMSLLYGNRVILEVVNDGDVRIDSLPKQNE